MPICPHCQTRADSVLEPCPTGDGFFTVEDHEYEAFRDDGMLGREVADRFVVSSVLGHGSMGRVYRAMQTNVGRSVALKIFRTEKLVHNLLEPGTTLEEAEDLSRRRFIQEAQVLGKLTHPNCVTLYDFGVSDDFLYIAMEYVAGISLRKAINRGLKRAALVDIGHQILLALRQAHSLDIVHRDLKPENIVLSSQPGGDERVVKVLDFGIAKLLSPQAFVRTRAGLLFGTPAYMSPEQCRGDTEAVGPRSDIYALGCLLYEMICGKLPFNSQMPQRLVMMHQNAEIPEVIPRPGLEIPEGLSAFVTRCLAKEPADRYADASTALHVFDRITTGEAASDARRDTDAEAQRQVRPAGEHDGQPSAEAPGQAAPAVMSTAAVDRQSAAPAPEAIDTNPGVTVAGPVGRGDAPVDEGLHIGLIIFALVSLLGLCVAIFAYIYNHIVGV